MRPEPFKKWTRPLRLQIEWMRRVLPRHSGLRLSVTVDQSPLTTAQWMLVQLRREGRRLNVNLCSREELAQPAPFYLYGMFLPVALHLFSRAPAGVTEAIADISDGSSKPSDHMLFSGNFDDAVLIPDPEFFNARAYRSLRARLPSQRPWAERSDKIVYRGATSGKGLRPHEATDLLAKDTLPRIRLCAMLASTPKTDVKIYRIVQSAEPGRDEAMLREAGLMGGLTPTESWLDAKFALDIDGNTNAWSNFYTRLLMGCCVLKVASPAGFRQWYYDRLEPYVHYVPVRADLSDLHDRIDWCRSNEADCARIAAVGQALALSMTIESEMAKGIARISERLGC